MMKYRIYLDNCCYFRPFDNQEQADIFTETEAKLYVQELVKYDSLSLVYSYISMDEIRAANAPGAEASILKFIGGNAAAYVGEEHIENSIQIASEIIKTGVKNFDALHVACAIIAKCDYFITTDKRLLKYKTDKITLINPVDFIQILEGENNV